MHHERWYKFMKYYKKYVKVKSHVENSEKL